MPGEQGATGREAKIGSIAVGKQADLMLVVGDPSTTIADVRNVDTVFRKGIGFDPVTFTTVNIARAKNRSLELIAQWRLPVGMLSGELTLQDPRDAASDTQIKRRARQSLALGWSGDVAGWSLRAALRHTGKRLDTDPVTFGDANNPARSALTLGVARELAPGWRASLSIDNATDSDLPAVLGYTAPPRSAMLSLRADFK